MQTLSLTTACFLALVSVLSFWASARMPKNRASLPNWAYLLQGLMLMFMAFALALQDFNQNHHVFLLRLILLSVSIGIGFSYLIVLISLRKAERHAPLK